MNLELKRIITPRNSDIIEAIAIRTAECYGAMRIINALAGRKSTSWDLVHTYTPDELRQGAKERGLVFTGEYDSLKGEIWEEGTVV